jgi:uncharacterized membrane protein
MVDPASELGSNGKPLNRLFQVARRTFQYLRSAKYGACLAVASLAYIVYWSYVSVSKFYAFHASVYDLGVVWQELWILTPAGGLSAAAYAKQATYLPISFLLSPVAMTHDFPLLLIVQTVAIAGCAFPIYLIARTVLNHRLASLAIAGSYLLYFPTAGANWFDVHLQAFFPIFFLTGYLMLLRRRYFVAAVLMFLAAANEYPLILLLILFALVQLVLLVARRVTLKEAIPNAERNLWAGLLIASTGFLGYQTWVLGPTSFSLATHVTGATGPFITAFILVFSLVLIPVLYTPLLSPRWAIMLAPFAYLVLYGEPAAYQYPGLFLDQYLIWVAPFVYLGCIYGLSAVPLARGPGPRPESGPRSQSLGRRTYNRIRGTSFATQASVAVLVATALMAVAYQPYGPLNGDTTNFDVKDQTQINWTRYNEFQSLSQLVPQSTPYVLIQNDMPMLLARPLAYEQTPLVSSITDWTNLSSYDVFQNSFPFVGNHGTVDAQIDYLIMNPYTAQYLQPSYNGFSMNSFSYAFLASGVYGVVGEVSSMLVLERGYAGPLELYTPFQERIPASSLWNGSTLGGQSIISNTNVTNYKVWWGPQTVLSPGTYRITFSLMTSNASSANHVFLATVANDGTITVGNNGLTVTGNEFNSTHTWTDFSYTLTVNNTYSKVEFPGLSATWNGTLSIRWVNVAQVSPPS